MPAWHCAIDSRLDKLIDADNRSDVTLETHVLVAARRLSELKTAPEGVEIEAIEPVERTARALQVPQLALVNSLGAGRNDNAMKDQS